MNIENSLRKEHPDQELTYKQQMKTGWDDEST